MLRLLVLLLLVANAGYFAWTRGLLAQYGYAPAIQSEPQRLTQQIRPEAVRILSPAPTGGASAPAAVAPAAAASSATAEGTATVAAAAPATHCLQAGLFSEEQTGSLRTLLESSLPAGQWVFENGVEPARWMVYMGKYSSAEAVTKKKGELRQLRVSFEALNNPALEPGLSLGSFATQEEATTELARIATRGVKTAKVIQSSPEVRGQRLKLASVDINLSTQLETIKPKLLGKTLQLCS